ncbi:hypothetical protein LENED_012534 [Lentinula edodes]|uniref:Uncharacterized protein n=1 Tax=Lentinula edodes TaxID=5353 RepID=A0A1Q3ESV8_LENED|nr:hypothetical protein LENED_012534 [Lentinula edodes]
MIENLYGFGPGNRDAKGGDIGMAEEERLKSDRIVTAFDINFGQMWECEWGAVEDTPENGEMSRCVACGEADMY